MNDDDSFSEPEEIHSSYREHVSQFSETSPRGLILLGVIGILTTFAIVYTMKSTLLVSEIGVLMFAIGVISAAIMRTVT